MLAILWMWAGVVYHLAFFTAINGAAWIFGAAFLFEATILAWRAIRPAEVHPTASRLRSTTALSLGGYALVFYPVLCAYAGHSYPRAPSLGAPCPVGIFTLGMLIGLRTSIFAAIIPLLWAVVGSSAAWSFGVYPDLMLIVAAAAYVYTQLLWPDTSVATGCSNR